MKNQVLHLLVPNEATGHKIIELSGWSGKCFIVPRVELREIQKRPEVNDPGLYFLFGEDDESTGQKLYIGESERFFDRLYSHDSNKEFWNVAIIFTGSLDKAKIKYLEYLSLVEAKMVNRYSVVNGVTPKPNSLSEFDRVVVEDYFKKINYILSVLGYPVFNKIENSLKGGALYYLKSENTQGTAMLLGDGSLNVLKGSLARIKETESFGGWALAARQEFVKDGTLVPSGEYPESFVFTRDVLFKSPSAAAATLTGRAINGWTAWKDSGGTTLDENLRK